MELKILLAFLSLRTALTYAETNRKKRVFNRIHRNYRLLVKKIIDSIEKILRRRSNPSPPNILLFFFVFIVSFTPYADRKILPDTRCNN
jgi:hypothetical protein